MQTQMMESRESLRLREGATLNAEQPALLDLNDIVGYVLEFPRAADKVQKKEGGNENERRKQGRN